jgi:hypothetical protein
MLSLFTIIRIWVYTAVIASSAIVLGLSGNFAMKFLPDLHRKLALYKRCRRVINIHVFVLQVTL